MNKLLKYLTLLIGIGSTSSLSLLSVSCDIATKPQKPNNSNNKKEDEVNPTNGSNSNSDSSSINNNVIYNPVDLSEIDAKYLKYTTTDFKEFDLNNFNVTSLMLNDQVGVNFYAHPDYKLDHEIVELDQNINNQVKVKLIDSKTNQPVEDQDKIKWYQRTRYPNDVVFKANQNDENMNFKLSSDGTVSWKEDKLANNSTREEQSAMLYAEYKGYLYPSIVKVYTKDKSRLIKEEAEARKAAKDIVEKERWKDLPILERLTKAYAWITKNVKYDYDKEKLFKNQSAHSALVERSTVCTGYAKGFQMICDELGIPCKVKEGSSSREANSEVKHAWNAVELDGEWYYVDPTSDRVENGQGETKFEFFLNTDKDFSNKDVFTKEENQDAVKFRNFKNKNFVYTVEDVLALVDNNADEKTGNLTNLKLVSDNFSNVINAFNQRKLELKGEPKGKILIPGTRLQEVEYQFKDQSKSSQEVKVVNVTKIQTLKNELAIQIKLDKEVQYLKPGNFNIDGALIKKVEIADSGKTYTLFLEHFNNFGKVNVSLDSIKRKGYSFRLDNFKTPLTFNIQKQEKLNVEVKLSDENKITLKNVNNNMQYRINNEKWKDIPNDNFVIEKQTIGNISIKYKDTANKISAEVQTIQLNKPSIQAGQLKILNKTIITGLSTNMEYKKIDSQEWRDIKMNVLKDLEQGTYQIRIKANKNNFASESETIKIN
ncbi:MAG6410 family transglutaminase-related lipoprotein [Mycoplasma putrefaciens]|uniref:Transglutaminase-like domain-containing protein n=1 Tax=Mycoplasma putrefaciens Mput9231 TaxID=1292033 RepID=M9WD05_9MOLU|nr:transglutaminase domain-containing protein [Mycoplasma putrefaciens]AGJ91037.1 Hypothetical protein, predicted lipoprotein [Mycoplasma putrefaciens Mput9231]